ncbi:arabinose-proton symporter-like [Ostrinia nubilalis]|uniref:arabinose-proton symporter-like n=1 Tax=Ostrinia nubilalis TaxID=29057 RepID=UPI00308220C6
MTEVEKALKQCGFGLFHVRLLTTSFLGMLSIVFVSSTTAFLLPDAECDLKMDLAQKGLLTAIPFIGMALTSIFTSFLSDAFGRKQSILTGLGGMFIFTCISASSQSFEMLLTSKFFEGVLYSTYLCSSISLVSEFCHSGIRDQVLLFNNMQSCLGMIVLSAMSWAILLNEWKYTFFGGRFVLHTWNVYLYAMSLFTLTAFIMFIFVPESPHYLISQNKYAEVRDVLTRIYRENHRNSGDKFPFKDLWKDTITNQETKLKISKTSFANKLVTSLHKVKQIFKKPLVFYLITMIGINSAMLIIYDVLRLWLPQIWTIIEHTSFETDDGQTRDICQLLDYYNNNNMTISKIDIKNTTTECIPNKSGYQTYLLNMMVNGASCLSLILSSILVKRLGKKILIITASVLAFVTLVVLRWASSKIAVIVLLTTVISVSSALVNLNRIMAVEYFPTSSRTLAVATMMIFGRMGTLSGNIGFPILLKIDSTLPFYVMDAVMFGVIMLSLLLPSTKK